MTVKKNQTVESGKILDTIKQISESLFGVVDKLIDIGSKNLEQDGNKTECDIPIEGAVAHMIVEQVDDDVFNITLTCKGMKDPLKATRVKGDSVYKKLESMIHTLEAEVAKMKKVKSSIHMNVTFKRILGTTEDSIEVKSIRCSDDPGTALMVIDNVLADPEIQDEIEDEASYDIKMDENEEIAVAECNPEECEGNPLQEMLLAAYKFDNIGMSIFYNAKGDKFQQIRNMTENWGLRYQIQTMSEWMVEIYGSCPSPSHFYQSIESLSNDGGYDYADALPIYQAALNDYISALKLHVCCLDEVKSQTVLNWLQDLDHNANYVIERTTL